MSTISGTGVSLSSTYFKRMFYTDNRDAATSSSRSDYSSGGLASADASAIRRAVKKLRSYTYDDTSDTNIRNSVSAYVETYNNLMSSGAKTGDYTVQRILKQIKALSSKYEDELDDIGVTVNSDGTLTARSAMLSAADISKFEKILSKDSDYMQKMSSYAKRIKTRSDTLASIEILKKNSGTTTTAASAANFSDSDETSGTSAAEEAAQLVSAALNLEQTSQGLGENINLYL